MGTLFNTSTFVLLIVILIAFFVGYQRGLIKIVFSLIATVLTIILASILFQPINYFLTSQTHLQENIGAVVQEQIEELAGQHLAQVEQSAQNHLIEEIPLPTMVIKYLVENNNQKGYAQQGVSNFAEYVSNVIALFLSRIVAFLITVVIVRVLLQIAVSVLGIAERLPGVRSVNHMGGGVVSLAELLLFLWLFCAFAAGISGTALGSRLQQTISNNLILGFLYEHNLLLTILSGVLGF